MALYSWSTGDRITADRLNRVYNLLKGVAGGTDSITLISGSTIDISAIAAATGLIVPSAAGAAPLLAGRFAYDSTSKSIVWGDGDRTITANPMTTAGDIVYGGATGLPTRLAKGTARQQLAMNSGATAPEWVASLQSLLTAQGDVVYASAANTPARLAKGTARQQLAINAGETAPEWVASMQSLLTAQADIIYASAANTPARLAKGTALQVLRINSGETAPEWAAIPADSAAATHIAASAAVHGLPASVNVLGNRSAASEFIQRGQASNADTTGSDTAYYLGNGFAVTFAVAFTGTPKVFVSYNGSIAGGNAIIASLSAVPTTTGFSYLISGSKSGTFTPPVDWLAVGA